jgi:hypothetical protein
MHHLLSLGLTFARASGLTAVNMCIVAMVLAFFWWKPAQFRRVLRNLAILWRTFERHPKAVVIVVALVPIVARIALLPLHPIPQPNNHDEFSYLLAADTFAHGRLTNPTHPLWQFFETYHVLPQPTYMSKYPPVQGMLLAVGQVLFGHPWWGVVLSIGLMAGLVCWMLQGWLPGRWAALGALTVALEFGVGHSWMNSYWGGAPAAIGACLVFGAFARLKQFRPFPAHPARYSVIMALGIAILLNSRPWEGMAVAIPAVVALLWWMAGRGTAAFFERALAMLVPGCALLAIVAAAMMFYNWRGTGNPLHMPYTVVHKTYSVAPLFIWQSRTPAPHYRHAIMERFYLKSEPQYQAADTLNTMRGWLTVEPSRLRMAKDLLFGNFFLLLCVALVFLSPPGSMRILLAALVIFMVAMAVESWNQIHYFGPVIGLAAILKMTSLRRLSAWTVKGKRIGLALASAVIICGGLTVIEGAAVFPSIDSFPMQRAAIQRQLESIPGSHVVIVRYAADHPPSEEWVYNRATIDDAKVIWARDMSDQEDQQLFDYFKGRKFWLIEPDVAPRQLVPLTSAPPTSVPQSSAALPHKVSFPWQ